MLNLRNYEQNPNNLSNKSFLKFGHDFATISGALINMLYENITNKKGAIFCPLCVSKIHTCRECFELQILIVL